MLKSKPLWFRTIKKLTWGMSPPLGEKRFSDTASRIISAIFFSAILPSTSMSAEVSQLISIRPQSASDFLTSLGVNTHIGWKDMSYRAGDGTAAINKVEQLLDFIGISRIRDFSPTESTYRDYQNLGKHGVHLNLFVSAQSYRELRSQINELVLVEPYLIGIEGPNEPDLVGAKYEEVTGPPASVALQSDLQSLVRSVPGLLDIPVVETSIGHVENYSDFGSLGHADLGNMHTYFFDFSRTIKEQLLEHLTLARRLTPGHLMVTTETGWPTEGDTGGFVDQKIQAALILDDVLDQFKAGVLETYIYQLLDEPASHDHYGLFDERGSPKFAATALHNFTSILANQNGFEPKRRLTISIVDLPQTGNFLLLEKSDDSFWLVLWNEVPIWDVESNTPLSPPDVRIKVAARGVFRACLFDPLRDLSSVQVHYSQGFELALPAHPIILEMNGNKQCTNHGF